MNPFSYVNWELIWWDNHLSVTMLDGLIPPGQTSADGLLREDGVLVKEIINSWALSFYVCWLGRISYYNISWKRNCPTIRNRTIIGPTSSIFTNFCVQCIRSSCTCYSQLFWLWLIQNLAQYTVLCNVTVFIFIFKIAGAMWDIIFHDEYFIGRCVCVWIHLIK